MKKLFTLLLIAFMYFNMYSQNTTLKTTSPPGTIQLNDSVYIDKTPVTNIMYNEFEKSVITSWSLKSHNAILKLPNYGINLASINKTLFYPEESVLLYEKIKHKDDSSITKKVTSEYYFNYPRYSYNPMLYISKEQAELFCKWRTDMVSLLWASKSKTLEERSKFPNKILYRLPTEKELEAAIIFFKNQNLFHNAENNTPITMGVRNPEEKFYQQNLSEFTLDEVIYGDNWMKKTPNGEKNNYTTFRCVCEVIE
nr:SUMF1/EgtB/PvdO family nonheme iron enzyme [uncultured Psychroserpens sp.]